MYTGTKFQNESFELVLSSFATLAPAVAVEILIRMTNARAYVLCESAPSSLDYAPMSLMMRRHSSMVGSSRPRCSMTTRLEAWSICTSWPRKGLAMLLEELRQACIRMSVTRTHNLHAFAILYQTVWPEPMIFAYDNMRLNQLV